MTLDHRLDRLMTSLKARERALLVLRAYKAHQPEDPTWRKAMPVGQYREFNYWVALINAANLHLGHLFTFVAGEIDKLELRHSLLLTLQCWQLSLTQAACAVSPLVREPISQTDYEAVQARSATERVSLRVFAELMAEQAWSPGDEEPKSPPVSGGDKEVHDVWQRLCDQAEAELHRAIEAGELTGHGRGSSVRVRRADFEAWWGQGPTIRPQLADEFDVRADGSPQLQGDRAAFAELEAALSPDRTLGESGRSLASLETALGKSLATSAGELWKDLRLVEMALAELADELGEDPVSPLMRERLETKRSTLLAIVESVRTYGYKVNLPEPDAADQAELHALVEHWLRL